MAKTSSGDDAGSSLLGLLKSLVRKRPHLQENTDLTEGIHDLMDEGQAMGFVSGEESDMVYRVLDLKDTQAYSIMVPRTEISAASVDSTLSEIIELVSSCGHTRIPIYRDSIDQIAGILNAKDLLKLWGKDSQSTIPADILRKPFLVHRERNINAIFEDLREHKTHLAIVTDDYGGTAGIITIEDILEEIVGEILDEHDPDQALLTALDADTIMVDARLEIEKLEEHFTLKLPEDDFESVGGFIIFLLGRIPKVGETIVYGELEMTIKSADERKIDKILITRRHSANPSGNQTE